MSGGAYEYVAGYVNNGDGNIAKYGESLVNAEGKYKNVYYSTTTSGSNTQAADYTYSNPNYSGTYPEGYSKKYGDAVWETSSRSSNTNSWYSDSSCFPSSSSLFFIRGGRYVDANATGVFYFNGISGITSPGYGFRVVVPVL